MPDDITIKIVMTAPSRVGKTSLLAAMAARIQQEVRKSGFEFLGDDSAPDAVLEESRARLERMATGPGMRTEVALGPESTMDKKEFPFTLAHPTFRGIPKIHLHFVDLPGEWYVGKGRTEVADKLLQEADVILVAVDAVALMENQGKYNKLVNNPKLICDNIYRRCHERAVPPLVLVVAVKAETYLRAAAGKGLKGKFGEDELRAKLKESYERLRALKANACAVETVGNIVFNDLREDQDTGVPIVTFRRVEVGYAPRYCSVPLRWIIGKILEASKKKIDGEKTIIDTLATMLGLGTDRTEAIEKLGGMLKKMSESTADGRKVSDLIFDV